MSGQSTLTAVAETLGSALAPPGARAPFAPKLSSLSWYAWAGIPMSSSRRCRTSASRPRASCAWSRTAWIAADAATVIGLLGDFFAAVNSLSSAVDLPTTIDPAEFRADFPQQLTGYLVADYLLSTRPLLGAILLAGGVITRRERPEGGKRPSYVRLEVAWDAVGNLVHDSLSTLRNAYGWSSPDFDALTFLDNMATLGDAIGYDVFSRTTPPHLKEILNSGATTATTNCMRPVCAGWCSAAPAGPPTSSSASTSMCCPNTHAAARHRDLTLYEGHWRHGVRPGGDALAGPKRRVGRFERRARQHPARARCHAHEWIAR